MKLFISLFLMMYFLLFGIAEAQIISGAAVGNKAINFVKNILSSEEDIEVYTTRTLKNFNVPEGRIKISISNNKYSAIGRHYTIPVNIFVENQKIKTLYVNVKAKIFRTVVKTNSAIKKSDTITLDNLITERTDITKVKNKDDLYTNKNKLSGMIARNYIPKGKPLTTSHVEYPPLVEKKKTIKVNASIGNIQATLYAIALENGKKGDVIKVMNPDTKKQFLAKVIDTNLATIAF